MKIKIAAWNINSVRSRMPRVLEWLKESKPDIVLLQETKCTDSEFPRLEFETLDYNIATVGQKTYNGVAILSKFPLEDVVKQLPLYGIEKSDTEARYIEAVVSVEKKAIRVASVYVPNGGHVELKPGQKVNETEKFKRKMRFYDRLKKKFKESLKNNEIAFFGGDYNTCAEIVDMYSPKLDGRVCCHIDERKKLREFWNVGMTDAFRALNPDTQDFTWWDYRTKGWQAGRGLRLDYIIATPLGMDQIISCKTESKETRGKPKPSDHAPVVIVL